MENKKGFTLVELLVVIALIAGITALAVSGIKTINNNQKEIQWESVKKEILTAGKQYFSSNKYLLEKLDKNDYVYVSVGVLVKENYLKKIIDPRTKEIVSNCNLVTVDTSNNYEFIENTKAVSKGIIKNKNQCDIDKPVVKYSEVDSKKTKKEDEQKDSCPTYEYYITEEESYEDECCYSRIGSSRIECGSTFLGIFERAEKCTKTRKVEKKVDPYDSNKWYGQDVIVKYNLNNEKVEDKIERTGFITPVAGCPTLSFKIDKTNPVATLSRTNGDIKFNLSGSDNDSGIVAYAFTTHTSSNDVTWENYSNSKSLNLTRDVAGKSSSLNYYLYLKDGAGNIGVSNPVKAYQMCERRYTKTPKDKTDQSVGKIYYWYSPALTGSIDCDTPNPSRSYSFKEIQCECDIDYYYRNTPYYCEALDNKDYKVFDITNDYHTNGEATVYYQNNENGKKACEKHMTNYVRYVCQQNLYTQNKNADGAYDFHGYYWYQGEGTNAKKIELLRWSINGLAQQERYDITHRLDFSTNNEKYKCQIACRAKYGTNEPR